MEGGAEEEGSAQGQDRAECNRHTEYLHGDSDGYDDKAAGPEKTQVFSLFYFRNLFAIFIFSTFLKYTELLSVTSFIYSSHIWPESIKMTTVTTNPKQICHTCMTRPFFM